MFETFASTTAVLTKFHEVSCDSTSTSYPRYQRYDVDPLRNVPQVVAHMCAPRVRIARPTTVSRFFFFLRTNHSVCTICTIILFRLCTNGRLIARSG